MKAGTLARRIITSVVPRLAPLRARKRLARLVNKIPTPRREQVILAILDDWARSDPAEYHRYLWSNHLSYAHYYDRVQIDMAVLNPLRLELLQLGCDHLRSIGVTPETDVCSFADIGCSLGYLPRYAETSGFPAATRIIGIDIDETALSDGASYLQDVGSGVELKVGDIVDLDAVLGDEKFDVITCTGVLQYLEEAEAAAAIATMLSHATRLFCISGPASADVDNATLERSRVRAYDRSGIHNFDRMIELAGGRVVARRWGGEELVVGNSVYLVIAEPPRVVR
jgi:SAM-dependent methyltransferase